VKQAKATLAELDGTTSVSARTSKKLSKKHKEAATMADAPEPNLQAMYQFDLEKVREAAEQRKPRSRQNELLRTFSVFCKLAVCRCQVRVILPCATIVHKSKLIISQT
jgi:hypothetical protein